jgi:hypothetical protein
VAQVGLAKWIARLLVRRPPKVIAASFFSLSAFVIVFGYMRGYKPSEIFLTLLAAAAMSLVALGLRWIEKRCPEPPVSSGTRPKRRSISGP